MGSGSNTGAAASPPSTASPSAPAQPWSPQPRLSLLFALGSVAVLIFSEGLVRGLVVAWCVAVLQNAARQDLRRWSSLLSCLFREHLLKHTHHVYTRTSLITRRFFFLNGQHLAFSFKKMKANETDG